MDEPSVLITGAGGFTARYLRELLTSLGYRVWGTGRSVSSHHNDLESDLCDPESILSVVRHTTPKYVVHLAGAAHAADSDVADMYDSNIVGTRNLLAALVGSGMPPPVVTVLASSSTVYGPGTALPIVETDSIHPLNDYAVTKASMEFVASIWKTKLPITIVRPFNYTGRGQSLRFVVPRIVDHFRRRSDVLELGNVGVVRDFSDVRRTCDAYVRLIQNPAPGGVFNIASGIGTSIEEIIGICSNLSNHRISVAVNETYVRPNEPDVVVGSCAALEQQVGPLRKISMESTLRWMLAE